MPVEVVKDNGRVRIQPIDKAVRDQTYLQHLETVLNRIGPLVGEQIKHQIDKHGLRRHDLSNWNFILTEEIGEVAQACLQENFEEAKFEITQTIACYVRLYVEIERMEQGLAKEERDWYTSAG